MRKWTSARSMVVLSAFVLIVGACGDDDGGTTASVSQPTTATSAAQVTSSTAPTGTQAPADTQAPTPTHPESPSTEVATTMESGPPALPAAPQRVEFAASDGKQLVGYYWPAAVNPAPVIVLMHWAGGDQRDWNAIAPWLQNRRDELTGSERSIGSGCGDQMQGPWLDPSWFPPMPVDVSFGVFTFDFRDFCESESGMTDPSEWALDALAALDTVAVLDGVDPSRIAAAGASIGADGAVDGSVLHNRGASTSIGGLSWSPGDYLMGEHYDMTFSETVVELDSSEPAIPVWCFAGEGEIESAPTCRSASGDEYSMHLFPGDDHGLRLITPEFDPNALEFMQDWLEVVFDVVIN